MKYLDWVHIGPRSSGRTYALASAARMIGAKLVCASYEQAKMLNYRHDVPTVDINSRARGSRGPYIFDHYTVEKMILDYESELERLRRELEAAHDKLTKTKALTNA